MGSRNVSARTFLTLGPGDIRTHGGKVPRVVATVVMTLTVAGSTGTTAPAAPTALTCTLSLAAVDCLNEGGCA